MKLFEDLMFSDENNFFFKWNLWPVTVCLWRMADLETSANFCLEICDERQPTVLTVNSMLAGFMLSTFVSRSF